MNISNKAGLIVTLSVLAATAHAEFSTNIGWASDYYYRGVFQKTSSANGGLDYSNNGFFVGTWAADVGDGLEVDGQPAAGAPDVDDPARLDRPDDRTEVQSGIAHDVPADCDMSTIWREGEGTEATPFQS